MSYPTDRDELARHLYVFEPDGPTVSLTVSEAEAGAQEWGEGMAKRADVEECYRRADRILAGQAQA
jgi:hypothetical protein